MIMPADDKPPPTPAEFAALSIPDQIKAVDRITEALPYGVRPDRPEAYVGRTTWPFADHASSGETRLALADIQDDLQAALPDAGTFRRKLELEWGASKKVLTLALDGFDWDTALKSGATETVLSYLSAEVWSFLVENGGVVGRQRLQTLQCMTILNRSLTMRAPSKSGAPSSGPATASDR